MSHPIFVEVALVEGMADAIKPLLDTPPDHRYLLIPQYFIRSQLPTGLAGVSFGNLLIKQVVSVLQSEHPNTSAL